MVMTAPNVVSTIPNIGPDTSVQIIQSFRADVVPSYPLAHFRRNAKSPTPCLHEWM